VSEPRRLPEPAEQLVVAAQASLPSVRLVGGAGLALLLGHRVSDDLDLFAGIGEDLSPVVRAVETAAAAAGVASRRVQAGPGFVRLEVPAGAETLRVDVACDTAPRLEDPTTIGPVRVESLRDQRANKMAALLGRSELRDLVDLYFIERAGLPVLEGFDDALKKDGGMDPAWFAWAVQQIAIRRLPGLVIPVEPAELHAFAERVIAGALDRAGA
jgi:Nucleotidyl transferase AbiEii toxin, Type IV TA system